MEILQQPGLLDLCAELQIVPSVDIRYVRFHPIVGQEAVLSGGDRRVGERVAAGVIVELVAPHVGIHGQQCVGIEGVLVTGSDVPRQHAQLLILG